jgi:hypothetical protein
MRDEGAQERQAVLAARHTDRETIAGPEHGEAPERLADGGVDPPLHVRDIDRAAPSVFVVGVDPRVCHV